MNFVSIIIPVYRVEQHIERCLRSVFRQDYQGPMECILIDDCTPDRSMIVAEHLLDEYQGEIVFRVFRHSENKGLSAARNTGIKQANGDYVFFLDSDDELMPHAISTLAKLTERYPLADLVYGEWYLPSKYKYLHVRTDLPEYITEMEKINFLLLRTTLSMTVTNKLIRLQYLKENHLFLREGILHEDNLWTYYLSISAQRIVISYIPVYVYYLNSKGIMETFSMIHLRDINNIIQEILDNKTTAFLEMTVYYCINMLQTVLAEANIDENVRKATMRNLYLLQTICKENHLWGFYLQIIYFKNQTSHNRIVRRGSFMCCIFEKIIYYCHIRKHNFYR